MLLRDFLEVVKNAPPWVYDAEMLFNYDIEEDFMLDNVEFSAKYNQVLFSSEPLLEETPGRI